MGAGPAMMASMSTYELTDEQAAMLRTLLVGNRWNLAAVRVAGAAALALGWVGNNPTYEQAEAEVARMVDGVSRVVAPPRVGNVVAGDAIMRLPEGSIVEVAGFVDDPGTCHGLVGRKSRGEWRWETSAGNTESRLLRRHKFRIIRIGTD